MLFLFHSLFDTNIRVSIMCTFGEHAVYMLCNSAKIIVMLKHYFDSLYILYYNINFYDILINLIPLD